MKHMCIGTFAVSYLLLYCRIHEIEVGDLDDKFWGKVGNTCCYCCCTDVPHCPLKIIRTYQLQNSWWLGLDLILHYNNTSSIEGLRIVLTDCIKDILGHHM